MDNTNGDSVLAANGNGAQAGITLTRDELDEAAAGMAQGARETAARGHEHLEAARDELISADEQATAGRAALAEGASNLTRSDDLAIVANRVGRLSEIVAEAGVMDIAEGAAMLAASDDISAMSDLVGLMSEADLEHGLNLARISGELRVAGALVKRLEMPILTRFLNTRSGELDKLAVNAVLQAAGSRVLSEAMAATGADVADLSAQEVAEGIVRLAAADAVAERSDELAMEAFDEAQAGKFNQKAAEELTAEARAGIATSIGDVARGSAELGAATVEGAVAEGLASAT